MKQFLKKYLPQPFVSFLRGIRHLYYSHKAFNHKIAQKGELGGNIRYMAENKYMGLLHDLEALRDRKAYENTIHNTPFIKTFFREIEDYRSFSEKIQDKRCLEIGSGTIGALALMPWVKERIIIDPLLEAYRKAQLDSFGKTFFTDDIQVYSQNAEMFIPSLEGSITGFIISRNTLDHCEDPWAILENISRYADTGCKLLLWTDLWHLRGLDEKHRNIIKDKNVFEQKLVSLGFSIDNAFSDVRNDQSTIEYGCIATKMETGLRF